MSCLTILCYSGQKVLDAGSGPMGSGSLAEVFGALCTLSEQGSESIMTDALRVDMTGSSSQADSRFLRQGPLSLPQPFPRHLSSR